MAPSAGKDGQKPTKTARRTLVQPYIPALLQKPKPRRQPAELGQEPLSVVSELSQTNSRRSSQVLPTPQEGEKELVEAIPLAPEPNPSLNGSKYGDEESFRSEYSSNAQKVFSAPESASTPASEVTNPPADQPKNAEDITKVDLGGGIQNAHQCDQHIPFSDSGTTETNVATAAEPSLEVSTMSRMSAAQQMLNLSRSYSPAPVPQANGHSNSSSPDRSLESSLKPASETEVAIDHAPHVIKDGQGPKLADSQARADGRGAFNASTANSYGYHNGSPENITEQSRELIDDTPAVMSTSMPEEAHRPLHQHVPRAGSRSDPLPEMNGLILGSHPVRDISDLEVVNGVENQHSEDMPASVLSTSNADSNSALECYSRSQPEETRNLLQHPSGLPSLYQHFFDLYFSRQNADCMVWVHQPSDPSSTYSTLAHGAILSRSPVFREMLIQARTSPQSANQRPNDTTSLQWVVPLDIQGAAFEAVLFSLYTDALLQRHELGRWLTPEFDPARPGSLEKNEIGLIVSYGLSGLLMGLSPLEIRGIQLFSEVMSWDVAEVAVKKALEIKRTGETSVAANASNERPLQDHHVAPAEADAPSPDTRVEYFGRALLALVFAFIGKRWDLDLAQFSLDVSQPPTLPTYLPVTSEFRADLRNMTLSGLQFGSMPLSEFQSSTPQCRAVSNILVNLPFAELQHCYTQLKGNGNGARANLAQAFGAAIQERERRRQVVLQSTTVDIETRVSHEVEWDVVGYRESLQNINGEMCLKRDRTTYLNASTYREA